MIVFRVGIGGAPPEVVAGLPGGELYAQLERTLRTIRSQRFTAGASSLMTRVTADIDNLTSLLPGGARLTITDALRLARFGGPLLPRARSEWRRNNFPADMLCKICAGGGCDRCDGGGLSRYGCGVQERIREPCWGNMRARRFSGIFIHPLVSPDPLRRMIIDGRVVRSPFRGDWIPHTTIAAAFSVVYQRVGAPEFMDQALCQSAESALCSMGYTGIEAYTLVAALFQTRLLIPTPRQENSVFGTYGLSIDGQASSRLERSASPRRLRRRVQLDNGTPAATHKKGDDDP